MSSVDSVLKDQIIDPSAATTKVIDCNSDDGGSGGHYIKYLSKYLSTPPLLEPTFYKELFDTVVDTVLASHAIEHQDVISIGDHFYQSSYI